MMRRKQINSFLHTKGVKFQPRQKVVIPHLKQPFSLMEKLKTLYPRILLTSSENLVPVFALTQRVGAKFEQIGFAMKDYNTI